MNQLRIITYALDDDAEDLMIMQEVLQPVCGGDLELYTDPVAFIAAIEKGVHICIIDHQLSAATDGIEVGRLVHAKNDEAFLILFSGNDSKEVWKDAMNAGFRYGIDKNAKNAYNLVADVVAMRLPTIRDKISCQNIIEGYKNKYEKYL